MNEQTGLTTLPFDSTEDNRREITAVQRRRLYRDLWSDMVVRAFTFTSVGNGNFSVNGACLVNGAYADFNDVILSTASILAGQTQVVARIVSDEQGGEDVGIRFNDVAGAHDLRIGTATIVEGPVVSQIVGAGLSPIRIPDRTITGAKLADHIIVNRHFANRSVTNAVLSDNSVTTRTIADGNVTNAKIANNAVSNARIADNAISNRNIANNAVGESSIANGSVTNAKIANNAVSTARIADGAVTNAKIATNAVTNTRIADGAVHNRNVSSGIDAGKMTTGTLPAARIATNAITATHIDSEIFITRTVVNGSTARTLSPNESRGVPFAVPTGYHVIGVRTRNSNLSVNSGSPTSSDFTIRNVSSTNTTIAAGGTIATLLLVRSAALTTGTVTGQIRTS